MSWSSKVTVAIVTVLVATGVSLVVASWWIPRTERHARNVVIEKLYHSQLASCERGISLREATRMNALATQKANRVLRAFLIGARPRAFAQSQDANISETSRIGAKDSLKSIDAGIAALSAPIAIPPAPLPCDQVITDPNASAPPHHN